MLDDKWVVGLNYFRLVTWKLISNFQTQTPPNDILNETFNEIKLKSKKYKFSHFWALCVNYVEI